MMTARWRLIRGKKLKPKNMPYTMSERRGSAVTLAARYLGINTCKAFSKSASDHLRICQDGT